MGADAGQRGSRIRLEWGPRGATEIVEAGSFAVVVDVLSFTTALTVAVEVGAEVYPYPWSDESVRAFAAERDAHHAVGRFEAARSDALTTVSLSPRSLARAVGLRRLVLPSPNGSTISFRLRDAAATVIGASLRNRSAVARWLHDGLHQEPGRTLALIPAGERWDDGSLRPAAEDLWGCGAVLAALRDLDPGLLGDISAEADLALQAFDAVSRDLLGAMRTCVSGQELAAAGFRHDVEDAARLDASQVVPVLIGERFVHLPTWQRAQPPLGSAG